MLEGGKVEKANRQAWYVTDGGAMADDACNMAKDELSEMRRAADAFAEQVDEEDEEQMAVLEEIRKRTKELERLRGTWNRRNTQGDWNRYRPGDTKRPPLQLKAYQDYKTHAQKEASRSNQATTPVLMHPSSHREACQGNSTSDPQVQG